MTDAQVERLWRERWITMLIELLVSNVIPEDQFRRVTGLSERRSVTQETK